MSERLKLEIAAKRDFSTFVQRAFLELEGNNLTLSKYLLALTWTMKRVEQGEITRLIINMPPRHLKSKVVSVMWIAWMLSKRPSASFAIVSHDEALVHQIAATLERLLNSAWYRAFAPSVRIQVGEDRARDFRTTAKGSVFACSIASGLTGQGFHFIILDDPQSALDVRSEAERVGLHHTFDSAIATRLDDRQRGVIVVVQQRLHEDDLSGHLLPRGGWEHLCIPLIAREEQCYQIGQGRNWHRPVGHITRPDQFPPGSESELIREIGLEAYAAQYQQDPSAETGTIISRDQLRLVPKLPPSARTHYVSVDTAIKAGQDSSYTAILHMATDGTNHFVVRVYRGKFTILDMVGICERLAERDPIQRFIIEDSANGSALSQLLGARGLVCKLQPVGKRSKDERLRSHIYFFIEQHIHVVGSDPWVAEFISELLRFPSGRYDDQVDALTLYLGYISTAHFPAPYLARSVGSPAEQERPPPRGDHPLRPRTRGRAFILGSARFRRG